MPNKAYRDSRVNVARRRLAFFLERDKSLRGEIEAADLLYGDRPFEHLTELRLLAMDRGHRLSDLAHFEC